MVLCPGWNCHASASVPGWDLCQRQHSQLWPQQSLSWCSLWATRSRGTSDQSRKHSGQPQFPTLGALDSLCRALLSQNLFFPLCSQRHNCGDVAVELGGPAGYISASPRCIWSLGAPSHTGCYLANKTGEGRWPRSDHMQQSQLRAAGWLGLGSCAQAQAWSGISTATECFMVCLSSSLCISNSEARHWILALFQDPPHP